MTGKIGQQIERIEQISKLGSLVLICSIRSICCSINITADGRASAEDSGNSSDNSCPMVRDFARLYLWQRVAGDPAGAQRLERDDGDGVADSVFRVAPRLAAALCYQSPAGYRSTGSRGRHLRADALRLCALPAWIGTGKEKMAVCDHVSRRQVGALFHVKGFTEIEYMKIDERGRSSYFPTYSVS